MCIQSKHTSAHIMTTLAIVSAIPARMMNTINITPTTVSTTCCQQTSAYLKQTKCLFIDALKHFYQQCYQHDRCEWFLSTVLSAWQKWMIFINSVTSMTDVNDFYQVLSAWQMWMIFINSVISMTDVNDFYQQCYQHDRCEWFFINSVISMTCEWFLSTVLSAWQTWMIFINSVISMTDVNDCYQQCYQHDRCEWFLSTVLLAWQMWMIFIMCNGPVTLLHMREK